MVSIGARVGSLRRVVTTTEGVTGFEDLAFEDEKKARSEPDGLVEEEIMASGKEREQGARCTQWSGSVKSGGDQFNHTHVTQESPRIAESSQTVFPW